MTSPDSGADGRKKKARRGRGEGSVFYDERRKEWVGSVSLGVDPATGKRNRPTIYAPSKKEAQQRLADLRTNSASELSRKRAPRLLDFVENWLENEVKPNRRATTYRSYRGIATKHILPHIGSIRVNQLSPTDVQRCISRVHETAGASMAGKARTILHRIMERACALEVAVRNPVEHVEAPRSEKRKLKFLTDAQLEKLFEAASALAKLEAEKNLAKRDAEPENTFRRLEALPLFLATTGMRQGEARALTWADVDLDAKIVLVTKTAQESKGPLVAMPTKTAAGNRPIELGAATVKALRKRQREARKEGFAGDGDFVFPTTTGTMIRGSNLWRRWWAPLLKEAGLEGLRIHDLRHSAASLSVLEGTHPKVIAEKLGHTNAAFTMRTYMHGVPSLHRKDAAAIDRRLAPKAKRKAKPTKSAAGTRR